jgi:RING-H2 zinc finger domain
MSLEEECAICYEPIDTLVYMTNNTNQVIIEGENSRLQCGHAYHTRCILNSLQHRSVCPLCNTMNQMIDYNGVNWMDNRIRLHGRCQEILDSTRKEDKLRESVKIHKEKMKELNGDRRNFQRKVKEFKSELRKEMNIENKIKELDKIHSDGIRYLKNAVKKKGSLFYGAVKVIPKNRLIGLLYGESMRFFSWKKRTFFI